MKQKTNKEKAYVYEMNLVAANILSVLIMILLFVITACIRDFSFNYSFVKIWFMFLGCYIWLFIHELLHGIGFRLSGAKEENIVYGIYLEKSILVTLCRQEISKKAILLSLIMPFMIIGIVTYIIGLIINNSYLIFLSIINLCGASMDFAMFLYILKLPKDVRYSESDNPTQFILISDDDLLERKNFLFKITSVKDYKKEDYIFPKVRKLTISNPSKILFFITLIITILVIIPNFLALILDKC